MWNLILLDRDGDLLEYILKERDDQIIALVCELHPKVTELIKAYPDRIDTIINYDDLASIQDVQSIDYELIAKLKFAQIDVETMLHRVMLNNPLAKDIYHQHLSLFARIFANNTINLLLSAEPNLASPSHHIPFALCFLLGIPCYSLNAYHRSAMALGNYNDPTRQRHIPYTSGTIHANAQNIAYYAFDGSVHRQRTTIKKYIKNIVLALGGEMLSQFLVALYRGSFEQRRLGIAYSYWDKLYYFFKYKQLRRFYIAHSKEPDLNEKYIYYSLHFEPEAAIIGKTLLESQLTLIKMLSSALPSGWKLYVKEHPHQFMLNNELMHYMINNLDFFKNISLYEEIMKLENVTLISLSVSSKDLMRNAQAVATIGGTISLESALDGVPAILFEPIESVYSILDHTLHVRSYADLKIAIQKIQSNFLQNKRIDLDKLNPYLADPNDANFYRNLFATIQEHAKSIKPTGVKI